MPSPFPPSSRRERGPGGEAAVAVAVPPSPAGRGAGGEAPSPSSPDSEFRGRPYRGVKSILSSICATTSASSFTAVIRSPSETTSTGVCM